MGFYVRPEYLETIHYYYFSIGIFSFMCSVMFGFSAVYSMIFILLYVGQSSFAWYLSWFMQKKMRQFVVLNSLKFAAQHVLLTFVVGCITLFLWFVNAFNQNLLTEFVLYLNYFVFFLAVIWYLVIKMKVTVTLFDVYDSAIIERAKNLVIKTRDSRKDIFTRSLASNETIKKYRSGSTPELDELMIALWKEGKGKGFLRRIAEIEMAMCAKTVQALRNRIDEISSRGVITPRDRATIESYSRMIDEYGKMSMEYEKNVLARLQASE